MEVVVTGAGIGGLITALLVAADGHDVTVLERDSARAPDPDRAWDDWERRGVNQFRLPHFFAPRFRTIVETEFPALAVALKEAGMLHFNFLDAIPEQMSGGYFPGDEKYAVLTGRRSIFESVIASYAEAAERVVVRRGTAVESLVQGAQSTDGVPHVTGVKTETGEALSADLVIDAAGRRSSLPRWFTDIGAQAPEEQIEECGFTYYGRHFKSADGTIPAMIGPPVQNYGSLTALTLPADNGTWSVTIVASARDTVMRELRDVDRWTTTIESLPLVAHWLDAKPLDDRVVSMTKIEDRHRTFTTDSGKPLATGVVAVADSWACTNPSLGRGASIGAIHALALRDLIRTDGIDDPSAFVEAWNKVTDRTVEPWYRTTLSFDRHRLNQVHAEMEGRKYESDDPEWTRLEALNSSAGRDSECLRATLDVGGVLRTPDEVFSDDKLLAKVMDLGSSDADAPILGPNREQLLAIVGG